MSTQTAQPDLAAVKRRQQQVWASTDYAAVAAHLPGRRRDGHA